MGVDSSRNMRCIQIVSVVLLVWEEARMRSKTVTVETKDALEKAVEISKGNLDLLAAITDDFLGSALQPPPSGVSSGAK